MEIDPVTSSRPTLKDVAKGLNQLHRCFEDHKIGTAKDINAIRSDMLDVKTALGLTPGRKKPAGLRSSSMTFLQMMVASATAIGALTAFYRLGYALWPGVSAFLKVLNTAIIGGAF